MAEKKNTWLGLSSYTYPFLSGVNPKQRPASPLTPVQLIDRAAELGVHCVQFSDNMPLEGLTDSELDAIRDHAAAQGVLLENGMRCMTPERLERYIRLSERMRVRLLRIIIDGPGYEPDRDTILRTIRAALPLAEQCGVTLAVENHDRLLAREYAELAVLTDHPLFGLVVDSTNSLSTEETMDEVLRWMAPYCVCCHIKDYVIKRSNSGVGLAIVGAPAGQGRQRIPELLERLRCEARQDFSTILESWMECCQTMEETLAQEDRWARESVAYLQVLPALRG